MAQIRQLALRSKRLPWLVLSLTLLILAAAIGLTTWQLRGGIRQQIAQRDGEVLHAVVLMEYENDVAQGIAGPISDPLSHLGILLKSSQLKGVLGIRLFDADGRYQEAFPPYVLEGSLTPADRATLQQLKPICHFRPHRPMEELFYAENATTQSARQSLPVLEVNVPLHEQAKPQLAGVAQFLLEGHSIASEYHRLDRRLAFQATVVFAAGGLVLSAAIVWAFRRVRRTQSLLAERTENLLRANQELALAAKTTALGSVAAHLIHGLKNPLAGLQSFVTAHGTGQNSMDDEEPDWQQVIASTRRMQSMINQVVSVLREEQSGTRYEITLEELEVMVRQRIQTPAQESGVNIVCRCQAEGNLPNRTANLVALILTNLAQNAIEATPRGGAVTLAINQFEDELVFEVRDQGSGFPTGQTPFAPCCSAKEGGSGIGLALSKQLASHLGANLELQNSSSQGCVFVLELPASLAPEQTKEVSVLTVR